MLPGTREFQINEKLRKSFWEPEIGHQNQWNCLYIWNNIQHNFLPWIIFC